MNYNGTVDVSCRAVPTPFTSGHGLRPQHIPPTGGLFMPKYRPEAERFWAKVNKNGPVPQHAKHLGKCWVWTASMLVKGYGAFGRSRSQKVEVAHRTSWRFANGEIPKGMCVLHACDTPACVRPSHLWLGTKCDNNKDMTRKGRHRYGTSKTPVERCLYKKGEAQHNAKLKSSDVVKIRIDHASGSSLSTIGKKFGVSTTEIWRVAHRQSWKHVK